MANIIGVKFKSAGKAYYFDPAGIEFHIGDGVVVETVRGIEYGTIAFPNREVLESELKTPVKPVLRKATDEDTERHLKNVSERETLMSNSLKKVAEHKLNMKVVDAEYTFDRSKIIIYFTAEGRVDFRELVKDLAGIFHIRIELRQIYERDDIKMRGALAACGRPCCCASFLQDFEKVSIKMAKVQGLSLNPGKISGCCGKLMCCLKYENQYYQDTYKLMPKLGSTAQTPDGEGYVLENNLLKQEVKVKITAADGSYEIKSFPLEQVNSKVKQSEKELEGDE